MKRLFVLLALSTSSLVHAQSLTFPQSTTIGCLATTATITLPSPAPGGGTTFTLTSSSTGLLSVPATATVAEGATTAAIPVTTSYVSTSTNVTLTATAGATTLTRTHGLRPNGPTSITLASSIGPSSSASGSFTLACVSEPGGTTVTMSSTSENLAVPATVTVVEGAQSGAFTATAGAFSAAETVTITAARGATTRTKTVTLKLPTPRTVSFSNSIPIGSTTVVGTVTLDSTAGTGGVVVAIATSDAAVASPAVVSVTVAAGATTATFNIATTVVNVATDVTITATANGTAKTGILSVRPNRVENVRASQFSVSTCRGIDGQVQLLVPAGAAGATVVLASDRPEVTITPTTLAFAPGQENATFTVTTTATPTTPIDANVTATFNIVKTLRTKVIRTSAVGCP